MVLMWLGAWSGVFGPRRARATAPLVRMPRAVRRTRVAKPVRPRPFWIRIDPQDSRHAAIGGSFEQVCAALERLADEEKLDAG